MAASARCPAWGAPGNSKEEPHATQLHDDPLILLAVGASLAARPASACEKAGQPFVLVVDRTVQVGVSSTYSVGDFTTYSINCAPANSAILWSSTLNGASTGEVNAYYGQTTTPMAIGRHRFQPLADH